MPSTSKTENLELNQWVRSDFVSMDDFNADNAAIEAAVSAKANIAFGSYTGTGTYGVDNKRSLTFDFEAKLVMIFASDGKRAFIYKGLNTSYFDYYVSYIYNSNSASGTYYRTPVACSWSDDGKTVYWYESNSAERAYNAGGVTYYYVALG